MERFQMENQGAATYLVYTLQAGETLDSMSMGMLTNNAIHGFARIFFTQIDQAKTVRYDVSGQVTLEQFYAGGVNRERLLKTFRGIAEALMTAEEYMIPLESVLLERQYIFVNVATCEVSLICLPVAGQDAKMPDPRDFFRNVMFSVQFDPNENGDYISRLINSLNSAGNFSLREFYNTLRKSGADDKTKGELYGQERREESPEKKKVVGRVAAAEIPPVAETAAAAPQQVAPQPAARPQTPPVEVPRPVTPPPAPARVEKTPRPAETGGTDRQPSMSLFYLLQHYNKENAALYKAQKEQKKQGGAQKPPKGGKGAKKAAKEKSAPQYQPPSFAVPGQPSGMPAPAPQPVNIPAPPPAEVPAAVAAVPPGIPVSAPVAPAPAVDHDLAHGDFGDTSFCFSEPEGEEDSSTVILGQEAPSQQLIPQLIRKRNQERIVISKEVFRLGRDTGFNDYVIADNKYIGHSHCYIVTRGSEYFIVDSNSKNHTSVDGVVIPSGQEVKLVHGCTVMLADEEFEFRLF